MPRIRAHRRILLSPVRPDRGQAARSFAGHCNHLQRNRVIPSMLPILSIANLERYNTGPEALRGRGNGAAVGPSSRRAPHPLFVLYRVRLVALVVVVVLFLFGAAGNEIPASSEEFSSSAAMAPPWSASARRAPRLLSFRAVRFVSNGPDYPFGVM